MNKPTLYIDFDNVVFNTVAAIKRMYDENYRLYDGYVEVPVENIKNYSFGELTLLTKEKLNEYFCSGRFFDLVSCIEGSELSISLLNLLLDLPIVFVSIGTPENIRGKELWVKAFNKGFDIDTKFIGIHGFDKSEIDMSGGILIDDELKNLNSSNADLKICFGNYDWNKEWSGVRAENWSKLRQIISGEVKKIESNNKT